MRNIPNDRTLRVLHLHHNGFFGGTERLLLALADAHRGMGVEHRVLLSPNAKFEEHLTKAGIRWQGFPFEEVSARVVRRGNHAYWRQLRDQVREMDPDVVSVSGLHIMKRVWMLPWLVNSPVLLHVHGMVTDAALYMANERGLLGVSEAICISDFVAGTFHQRFPAVPFRMIHNGINLDDVQHRKPREETRRELGLSAEATCVLMVANFDQPCKRHDVFIRAAALLRDSADIVWLIAGGYGAERSWYDENVALARDCGARVRFLGFQEDVASLMNTVDIVALCTESEGFGLVILEAMAAERPVIASDSGACPELIEDGVSGLLFKTGVPEELAGCVRRLADSPELRSAMGRRGHLRVASDFTIAKYAQQMRLAYCEAIASRRSPAARMYGLLGMSLRDAWRLPGVLQKKKELPCPDR